MKGMVTIRWPAIIRSSEGPKATSESRPGRQAEGNAGRTSGDMKKVYRLTRAVSGERAPAERRQRRQQDAEQGEKRHLQQ